jgi:hypothetical protein
MRLTNKTIELLSLAILKECKQKEADFVHTDQFSQLLAKEQAKLKFPELSIEYAKAFALEKKINKLEEQQQEIYKKILLVTKTNNIDREYATKPSSLEFVNSVLEKRILSTLKVPSLSEIELEILMTNDTDLNAIKTAVLSKFNL